MREAVKRVEKTGRDGRALKYLDGVVDASSRKTKKMHFFFFKVGVRWKKKKATSGQRLELSPFFCLGSDLCRMSSHTPTTHLSPICFSIALLKHNFS